jgi:hypothetical protein
MELPRLGKWLWSLVILVSDELRYGSNIHSSVSMKALGRDEAAGIKTSAQALEVAYNDP